MLAVGTRLISDGSPAGRVAAHGGRRPVVDLRPRLAESGRKRSGLISPGDVYRVECGVENDQVKLVDQAGMLL